MWHFSSHKISAFLITVYICGNLFVSPSTIQATGVGGSGELLLINKWNPIVWSYQPTVVDVKIKGLFLDKPGFQLDKTAAVALKDMVTAAAQQGYSGYILTSAYRTYEYQQRLYEGRITQLTDKYGDKAAEVAAIMVAAPGTSEHHTGLAVDLSSWEWENADDRLVPDFGKTETGRWLQENSWKYGWIARYPANKQMVTGIIPEPWHFRYVGKPHAEIIYQNGLALEEYYDFLEKKGVFDYVAFDGAVYKIAMVKEKSAVDIIMRIAPPDIRVTETIQKGYILTLQYSAE